MTKLTVPALLCAAALAACGGGQATTLQPGQWDMNMQVVRMEAPSLPKGTNVPLPPAQTISQCLTPEQAANPGADFAGGGDASGCSSDDYRMEGGRISGTMQCNQAGTNMRATVSGSYTQTSMDMTMNSDVQAQGQNMTMETRISGRRTGECRAGS